MMKQIARFFLVLILTTLCLSCALKRPARHAAQPTPKGRQAPVTGDTNEKMTPERTASNALIDQGKSILNQGSYDRSADLFQEAVTVDPTNGPGFYYLALVKFKSGEYGAVAGFLEKAEILLSHDPDWMQKVNDLKRDLQKAQPN